MDTTFTFSLNQEQTFPSIFSIVFPIITLIIGACIGFVFQKIDKYIKRKETQKYLKHSIASLIVASEAQLDYIKELLEELSNKPDKIPNLSIKAAFHLKNIEIIPRSELFSIFVLKNKENNNLKSEYLNKFIDTLEMISYINNSFHVETQHFRKAEFELIKEFNNNFIKLRDTINKKIINYISQPPQTDNKQDLDRIEKQKELTIEIQKALKKFHSTEDSTKSIYQYYEDYIIPVFKLGKHYNDAELVNVIPECLSICQSFISTRNTFEAHFIYLSQRLEIVIKDLKQTQKFLT